MRDYLSWKTIYSWQKVLFFNVRPTTTYLERPHFYGQWGGLSKQVQLYQMLEQARWKACFFTWGCYLWYWRNTWKVSWPVVAQWQPWAWGAAGFFPDWLAPLSPATPAWRHSNLAEDKTQIKNYRRSIIPNSSIHARHECFNNTVVPLLTTSYVKTALIIHVIKHLIWSQSAIFVSYWTCWTFI